MTRSVVLGINAAHDAAACLLIDGEIAVAVAEERLARTKHYEGFPERAVEYCLQAAGLGDRSAVDTIVINQYTKHDSGLIARQAGLTGDLIMNPSHHLLHAYYAWVAADFARPAVLVLDGAGYNYGEYERRASPLLGPPPPYSEMEESESMYMVDDSGELRLVRKRWALWDSSEPFLRFPSLGHLYSVASEYIFGHMMHAGKTMGLAAYGDPDRFGDPLIEYTAGGLVINTEWITRLPPRSAEPAHRDNICRDVAAKVQAEVERAVLYLCRELHELTGATELALSGGVGLNSVANGMILARTPFDRLFVTPAAGDSGVAIGAALYGYRQATGERARWRSYDNYHGHTYADTEVRHATGGRGRFVTVQQPTDPAEAAAHDIAAGSFVGWFEGGSEFGPRALGHRSILCDPRPREMRDRLNTQVKFREPFRPYAASVLSEHVKKFFDLADLDPFMMTVASVREPHRPNISSVCHADQTCRLQTVDHDHPGGFRRLIEKFHDITGLPLVLNTSFNVRGEPIVESPDDAIRCFLSCGLDVLYLSGYRLTKHAVDTADDPAALVPCLNDGVTLGVSYTNQAGAAVGPVHYWQSRTGRRTPVSPDEFALLTAIDARATIGELIAWQEGWDAAEVMRAIADLQHRGLICLARDERRP